MTRIQIGGRQPLVDNLAWVAASAVLIGKVEIRERASIWYGAVLRADGDSILIGANTNVQDAVVVHADPGLPVIVGQDGSIGHGAILHGCTLEDQVLVGMGARLLNGARIGSGVVIAAGSVVLEGTDVPPNCLVAGVPAKVRRGTTPEERCGILRNAASYNELAAAHAAASIAQA